MARVTPLAAFGPAPSSAQERAIDAERDALSRLTELSREFAPDLDFTVHTGFDTIESEWCGFEQIAEATPFQSFEWLETWHRHIGSRDGVVPVIVVGHFADGQTAFIAPFAVERRRGLRRLCWLGQELGDYNAPLLARDFSQRVTPDRFLALWRDVQRRLQSDRQLRYDWIEFEKMPQTVGAQPNPFVNLDVIANANSAHVTQLGDDWEAFYSERRSSATRRRDRAKRKRMSEFGEIKFATAAAPDELSNTLEILWQQKQQIFARKGIADIFARPGYREFFADFASSPKSRHLAHVSRVDIGDTCAAANFAIVFGGCYYHVLSSYCHGRLTRYGPGVLHLRELLAYAIKRGLRRFDFTVGDEPYKLEWSDSRVPLYDFIAAATWRGTSQSFASLLRRRIKRFIKQTPLLWDSACRLRSALAPLVHPAKTQRPAPTAAALSQPRPVAACVMGDMDLLQAVTAGAIPCAVAAPPGAPVLYSRFAKARLHWNVAEEPERLVDALVQFGQAQGERPVLFYQGDDQLLLVSRYRQELAKAFRFVIADAALIEDLVDKGRFAALAERLGLPVPAARRFNPAATEPTDLELKFPVIIKPVTRLHAWNAAFGLHKAFAAENPEALRRLWPQLRALDIELMAQQLIPGDEARIESYHCYVDAQGEFAGEFTGRKIRTYPTVYGHTTALEITDAADVRRQGRSIVKRLKLNGVAKLDFKRDRADTLHLLEINPRFTLWQHAAALAGVNIPALVYADLTGTPRPPLARAKAGVRWCRVWKDLPAARQCGLPRVEWLAWVLGCEAKSVLTWNDPMPALGAALHRAAARLGWRGTASHAGRYGS